MISTIYLIHGTDPDHLEDVKAEMRRLGAPTIRVVDCGDHYFAIEGAHRLVAAAELGIVPHLVVLGQDDIVAADSLDINDLGLSVEYTASALACDLFDIDSKPINIEHDGALSL